MYKIVDHLGSKAIVDENNDVVCMGTQNQLNNIMQVLKLFRTSVGIIKRWPKEDGSGEDVEDGELEYFLGEINKIGLKKLVEFRTNRSRKC